MRSPWQRAPSHRPGSAAAPTVQEIAPASSPPPRLATRDIPQVDRAEVLLLALRALDEGTLTATELANVIGQAPRHGQYVAHALRVLGLLVITSDGLRLTAAGCMLLGRDSDAQLAELRSIVVCTPPFDRLLDLLDHNESSSSDVAAALEQWSALRGSTAQRRASALLHLLADLGVIYQQGGLWRRPAPQEVERADPLVAAWLNECGL